MVKRLRIKRIGLQCLIKASCAIDFIVSDNSDIGILQTFLPKTLDVDAILAALEPIKAAITDAKADGQAMGVALRDDPRMIVAV